MEYGLSSKFALLFSAVLLLIGCASAEDKLKPFVEETYKVIQQADKKVAVFLFSLFPSLQDSLDSTMHSIDVFLPFMKGFHWVFYLAGFIAFIAVFVKLWDMSKRYIINSIVGILLLLICIHVLGVELKITILSLLITALFGVLGVVFILVMHYIGVVI